MAVPPPIPDLALPDRATLRRGLRAARSAFAALLPDGALARLHTQLRERLPAASILGGYLAHRGEPDVMELLAEAVEAGRGVALPRVGRNGAMHFAEWRPDDVLEPGPNGIAQPPVAAVTAIPDLLLVPLLGFDARGNRLGQGGGHYDRWCAAHPHARRIGVAWSVQQLDAVVAEPWDMPLDAIATECAWIEP